MEFVLKSSYRDLINLKELPLYVLGLVPIFVPTQQSLIKFKEYEARITLI
jgi:hypothetical protein